MTLEFWMLNIFSSKFWFSKKGQLFRHVKFIWCRIFTCKFMYIYNCIWFIGMSLEIRSNMWSLGHSLIVKHVQLLTELQVWGQPCHLYLLLHWVCQLQWKSTNQILWGLWQPAPPDPERRAAHLSPQYSGYLGL